MKQRYEILVVDDEPANLQKLKRTFMDDFVVHEAAGGEAALELLHRHPVAAVITDQRMPGMTGVELLKRCLEIRPQAVRVILTGYTDVEDMMDAINQGHVHRYITKPWDPFSLRETIRRELERWELERENERLAEELRKANEQLARENLRLQREMEALQPRSSELIHQSRVMAELLALVDRVVATDATVLIQGETGTGKELIARYIHEHSPRRDQPFVPVNCGAIPADLVESSFFGHRKGAFTGATADHKGFFVLADGGTLFLDEIGEAPLDLQVKLLRVLQEGEILPVGADRPRRVDVRILASTNRQLVRLVEEGSFRQDLFFRLNVFSVWVPPLRERPEDIPLLARHFLERTAARLNKEIPGFTDEAVALLQRYSWPGNVRELENEVERLVILAEEGIPIGPALLSDRIRFAGHLPKGRGELRRRLAALEREAILDALRRHGYNKTRAAAELGITRQTIISKLREYDRQDS
ncbi:MAG: sigma 54-interacting transcriptional regulator [Acidobacteriota bacterium]